MEQHIVITYCSGYFVFSKILKSMLLFRVGRVVCIELAKCDQVTGRWWAKPACYECIAVCQ